MYVIFPHTCTIQRLPSGLENPVNALGIPAQRDAQPGDDPSPSTPCYFRDEPTGGQWQEVRSEIHHNTVISEHQLLVPATVQVAEQDRISNLRDQRGLPVGKTSPNGRGITYEVEKVKQCKVRGNVTHLSLLLRRVGKG